MKCKIKRSPWHNLDKWQTDFLETKGDKQLCTGRQVGKSVVCAKDAGDYARTHTGMEPIVMIAPLEKQALALFEKTLQYLTEFHPNNIILKGKDKPTKNKMTLKNGVKIYCLPVGLNGLGVRFLTIGRLYADEASRIPGAVWTAVTPALLTTGGDTVLLSTPHGAQGEFYNAWINKDGAYNSFTRFSINSEEVIKNRKISESWTELQREKGLEKLKREKARMSKMQYAQEYMGEFLSNLRRVFSDTLIDERCLLERQRYKGGDYYLGVDVGRVYDPSTFEILWCEDPEKIMQSDSIVKQKELTTETARVILRLEASYDFRGIGIDDGGMGVGVLDPLLENDATKRKVVGLNNAMKVVDNDGAHKKLLKEDMYNHFLSLMEHGFITLLKDIEVIASLRSVQYEYTENGIRIFGDNLHIVEGLIRATWLIKTKSLNIFIY